MLNVWSRKKKGLPVARVISHFDLSLPAGTFSMNTGLVLDC
jgi:hypothetical protein